MTTNNFISLAQLCADSALLGSHLLSMSKSLSGSEQPSESSKTFYSKDGQFLLGDVDMWMQVEMLIRAHDCYTLGCSVDGIAEVLKVSREVTNVLYQGRHYKLMVRWRHFVSAYLIACDEIVCPIGEAVNWCWKISRDVVHFQATDGERSF